MVCSEFKLQNLLAAGLTEILAGIFSIFNEMFSPSGPSTTKGFSFPVLGKFEMTFFE